MPSEFSVGQDVEEFIQKIISKYNLQEVSEIKYQAGSEAGDGYASKTVAVDILNGNKSFRLFLKCALNIKLTEAVPITKLYSTEIHFYDVVYPAYLKFVEERGAEDGFRHAPKCYGTSPKNIVALENLKDKGFALFDRRQTMNENHIVLVFKTFAKFHAISFAFKDQKREEYDKFLENTFDFWSKAGDIPGMNDMMERLVNDVLETFDPVEDKHILDKCDGLVSKMIKSRESAQKSLNEYSIITQGDCWCNNMMFLYEENDNTNPIDIKLIDWQVLRPASPVFDLSYFFYTIASQETLDNLQNYLKLYYEELSKHIRRLGSDPDILYPFEILQKEWTQHCIFGIAVGFQLIRMMLSSKEEAVNLEDIDFENIGNIKDYIPKLKNNEDEYYKRMRILVEHMVENDYL